MEDIEVDIDNSGEIVEEQSLCLGNICGEEVEGRDCGQEVADWLEDVLCLNGLKLVRGERRRSTRQAGNVLRFNTQCLESEIIFSCLCFNSKDIHQNIYLTLREVVKIGKKSVEFFIFWGWGLKLFPHTFLQNL